VLKQETILKQQGGNIMKNKLSLLFLVVSMVLLVASSVSAKAYLKLGLEPSGRLSKVYGAIHSDTNLTTRTNQVVESGISLAGEFLNSLGDHFAAGGGFEYQFSRKVSEDNQKFSYLPLYFIFRSDLPATKKMVPFLIGKAGYSFYDEPNPVDSFTLSGGIYYGVGAGLIIQKNLVADFMYSCSNSEARSESLNLAVKHQYTKYTMSVAYRF
jgi:hypothetical protein